MKYKLHPLCEAFPKIKGNDFQTLKADIAKNGLHEPITILGEYILDGQNRYNACIELGIEPDFDEYLGDNPEAFVISKNLARRHLNTGQRAMIAAKLANLKHGGNRQEDQRRNSVLAPTLAQAADNLNVSRDSVVDAKKIMEKDPKLARKVKDGKITLNKALQKLKAQLAAKESIQPRNVHHEHMLNSERADLRQQIRQIEDPDPEDLPEPAITQKLNPNPAPTQEDIDRYSDVEIARYIEFIFKEHPEWNHHAITNVILQTLLEAYGRPPEEPECPF